ncbi:Gfo/Idh/MocA family oxidoreductase [Phyllobacterium sp. YR531]|uniref:Gfo/Idh/MocA family protein n=1 Tax=Phyllobacterium sp. YR531 TaxID=1144343 RepID=UPI00026FB1BE|nr:Gfo/Idh/MocA family oxidoreductase [Phyllobacterium sp. YR531]EJN06715.1 putative dehydrogenase [Phyllobacterium sp. YR531]
MKKIRIGLVGAGFIGKMHVSAILAQQDIFEGRNGTIEWAIVCDANGDAAQAVASRYGFERHSGDWRDALACKLDLLIVATPNESHYEISRQAIEHGINVFCEKPLTTDPRQSQELSDLAKTRQCFNYVGFIYVTAPQNVFVKNLVVSGKLGKITRVTGTFDYGGKLDPNMPINWRMKDKNSKSGVLGDTCTHVLSTLKAVLGDTKRVVGIQSTIIKERPIAVGSSEMAKVQTDDITQFLIEYKNGTIGSLGCTGLGGGHPIGIGYELQGLLGSVRVEQDNFNEVYVHFGNDEYPGFKKVKIAEQYSDGVWWGSFSEMMMFQFNKVFDALVNGADYECDFSFGAEIDRVIDAIQQSADENRWVDL